MKTKFFLLAIIGTTGLHSALHAGEQPASKEVGRIITLLKESDKKADTDSKYYAALSLLNIQLNIMQAFKNQRAEGIQHSLETPTTSQAFTDFCACHDAVNSVLLSPSFWRLYQQVAIYTTLLTKNPTTSAINSINERLETLSGEITISITSEKRAIVSNNDGQMSAGAQAIIAPYRKIRNALAQCEESLAAGKLEEYQKLNRVVTKQIELQKSLLMSENTTGEK
jgi:hypothetical protein